MTSVTTKTFVVGTNDVSGRTARRIVINAEIVKTTKLCAGDAIAILSDDPQVTTFAVGVVWPSTDISHDTILISKSLLLTAHLTPGAKVQLHPLTGGRPHPHLPQLKSAQAARTIRVREVLLEASSSPADLRHKTQPTPPSHESSPEKRRDWLTLLVREVLVDQKYLTPTQIVELSYEGRRRRFAVSAVNAEGEDGRAGDLTESLAVLSLSKERKPRLWTVDWNVTVRLERDDDNADTAKTGLGKGIERNVDPNAYAAVGGLDKQIAQIRDLIEIPLTRPELFRRFGLKPPRGILLHGPPGTGKTHLARAIAASTRASLLTVNGPELSSAYHGETEAKLRDVFAEARERAPCIVVLDEVDALCPRREDGPGGEVEKRVVAQLLTIMDGMEAEGKEERVVVVATTNRPNAIDPALRRPGRFDREFEIGIPDAEARFHILTVLLSKTPHSISPDNLRAVAAKAHGYVGADLSAVVREAGTLAIKRWLASFPSSTSTATAPSDTALPAPELTLPDLVIALPTIRPSALRSLLLDLNPVRYTSIGGQAHTIQKLRECVEWPLLHPEAFARLGVHPPRGVLLYGPPGCSKTLLVRACATESGVNFLAVKGPELLNKYVGESERAVREIFSKARGAAPSLIFFDEIDALATSRTSSDTSGGAHEGVLTSLLNEMDGVQELVGVTIVAATNRPEALDSALMRPGRLDRILYVGPPDAQGREEILRIRTAKMSVESGMDHAVLAQMTEGCSGAELAALCQEAALNTMKMDMNAPFVPCTAFMEAAKAIKRQITPDVVAKYERWRDQSAVGEA
ncbi:AAA family ATPase [Rhodofomes roseus]|uniref:AAA family ATPase n=1 Tax=Rhodofomes roseus TaxID=34475 RepID=A0ABQ8K3H4_9APHY|nr:AAA family ATPase [Rhodofomes roseus]KAH9831440.1 AAA family ATPase [Rhodofomes roseus]